MEKLLYTVEEVAEALRLSSYTIRRLLKEGKLSGVKVGGGQQWRIKKQDLEAYLNGQAGQGKKEGS